MWQWCAYVLLNSFKKIDLFNGNKLTLETISGFYEVFKINKKKYKVSMGEAKYFKQIQKS